MTAKTIEQRVAKCISEVLGIAPTEINPEQVLEADLGADSLDVLEIAMALEEEFDCQIDDDRAAELKTVQDVIGYMRGMHAEESEGGAA